MAVAVTAIVKKTSNLLEIGHTRDILPQKTDFAHSHTRAAKSSEGSIMYFLLNRTLKCRWTWNDSLRQSNKESHSKIVYSNYCFAIKFVILYCVVSFFCLGFSLVDVSDDGCSWLKRPDTFYNGPNIYSVTNSILINVKPENYRFFKHAILSGRRSLLTLMFVPLIYFSETIELAAFLTNIDIWGLYFYIVANCMKLAFIEAFPEKKNASIKAINIVPWKIVPLPASSTSPLASFTFWSWHTMLMNVLPLVFIVIGYGSRTAGRKMDHSRTNRSDHFKAPASCR